jgi:hypothetical protein
MPEGSAVVFATGVEVVPGVVVVPDDVAGAAAVDEELYQNNRIKTKMTAIAPMIVFLSILLACAYIILHRKNRAE